MATSGSGCICSVCSCGKHHCREHGSTLPRSSAPCYFETTQKTDFAPQGISRTSPIKHAASLHPSGAFDGTTQYAQDYPPKSVPFEKREKDLYIPNKSTFEGTTTAKQDFVAHPHARRSLILPPTTKQPSGVMDCTTSNQDALQVWPLERHQRRAEPERKPPGPFDGDTSYTLDYPARAVERTQPIKPSSTLQKLGPFEANTTMRDAFIGTTAPRAVPFRPEEQRRSLGAFDGTTVSKQDYVAHAGTREAPFRPKDAPRSLGPFEGRTDNADSYPQHAIAPRQATAKAPYQPNKSPFQGTSTTQTDFVPKDYARRDLIVQAPPATTSGPGDYNTTYGQSMQAWTPQPAKSQAPTQAPRSLGPFEGTTETRDNFTPKRMSRTSPIKPLAVPLAGGPVDYNTCHRDTYISHELPCSVLRLPASLWKECQCSESTHPHSHGPKEISH